MRSLFLCENTRDIERVYAPQTIELLQNEAGLEREVYSKALLQENADSFGDVHCLFSTWGMPSLRAEEIERFFPSLQAVFYAAGSVQYFAKPFLDRGVRIFSAQKANAVPVADYTTAQILLANKGFFRTSSVMKTEGYSAAAREGAHYPGNYDTGIGILGAGAIGSLVIERLKALSLEVLVFDPFLPDERAALWGVRKTSLAEIFSSCRVISNHLANNAETRGLLDRRLFESTLPYTTFLNTGRGAQVVEQDLIDVLLVRPDLVAILDVTDPEPPVRGSLLYTLPNCLLTPHIAGSIGREVRRMSAFVLEEYRLFAAKQPCRGEITREMLEILA